MTVFQAAGLDPLKVRLGALGGWPLIEPVWNDEGFLWSLNNFLKKETENTLLNARHEFLAKMQKNSFSPTKLMQLEVMGDLKNSSWPVLYVSQPQLGLIKEYLDKVYKNN